MARYQTTQLCGRAVKLKAPPIQGWHRPACWASGLQRVYARNPDGRIACFKTFADALAFAEVPEDAKDLRTCRLGSHATTRCFRSCRKREVPPAGTPVIFARFPTQEDQHGPDLPSA